MIIKKLLISLVSIFIIFVSFVLIIYTLFIYKPENLVQFIDRFLLDEYKIKYQDISSESKLLELKLGFKNLLLENNANIYLHLWRLNFYYILELIVAFVFFFSSWRY